MLKMALEVGLLVGAVFILFSVLVAGILMQVSKSKRKELGLYVG